MIIKIKKKLSKSIEIIPIEDIVKIDGRLIIEKDIEEIDIPYDGGFYETIFSHKRYKNQIPCSIL